MKVLLITNQYIDVREDGCYCFYAMLGTLKNMSILGDLYVICNKGVDSVSVSQPIDQRIDFINKENVYFLHKKKKSIIEYICNRHKNNRLIDQLLPSMDLVIGYCPLSEGDYAQRQASKYGIPFLTFLVSCPWDALHNHKSVYARFMAPFCYLATKQTVKNSEYVHYVTKQFLQNRYPTQGKSLGCSDTNIGVFNTKALSERLQNHTLKKSEDIVKLVTTAHIDVKYKGQEFVFQALSKMKRNGITNYRYYLIGAGKGTRLRSLCKKYGIEDMVIFLGRKTAHEVMEILYESDIYLQPSLQEGLPRSVVEAMSTALPCIGFNTGGIPELLDEQYVVKKKNVDGIVECINRLSKEEEYVEQATYSFMVAKEFDYTHLTSTIQEFYKNIRLEIENRKKN